MKVLLLFLIFLCSFCLITAEEESGYYDEYYMEEGRSGPPVLRTTPVRPPKPEYPYPPYPYGYYGPHPPNPYEPHGHGHPHPHPHPHHHKNPLDPFGIHASLMKLAKENIAKVHAANQKLLREAGLTRGHGKPGGHNHKTGGPHPYGPHYGPYGPDAHLYPYPHTHESHHIPPYGKPGPDIYPYPFPHPHSSHHIPPTYPGKDGIPHPYPPHPHKPYPQTPYPYPHTHKPYPHTHASHHDPWAEKLARERAALFPHQHVHNPYFLKDEKKDSRQASRRLRRPPLDPNELRLRDDQEHIEVVKEERQVPVVIVPQVMSNQLKFQES